MKLPAISAYCVLFCAASMQALSATSVPVVECSSLAGVTVNSAAIALPTHGARVVSAELEKAEGDPQPVCVVKGAIAPVDPAAPPINFQINLPSQWNDKALHLGGGGWDGALVSGRNPNFLPHDREPVRLGYATFGSDSGHAGGAGNPRSASGDASFAMNHEALVNFGGAQLKKTHDVALAIIDRYYGHAPRRMYFYGNSQGGHEGLIVAQRYGADYDGVVAIHPAYALTELQLSGLLLSQAIYNKPGAWLSPEKVKALNQAVVAKCDALDGLEDGIVSNVPACRSAFDVRALRCPGGSDSASSCLSDAQIAAVQAIAQPAEFGIEIGGMRTFPGWPILEGAFVPGTIFGLGSRVPPASPPTFDDAIVFLMADQAMRFIYLHDPGYDTLKFRIADHADALRSGAAIVDANSPNLDDFRKHGGKLLLMHGTIDMAIPPGSTVAYYRSLQSRYGAQLPSFVRFYLASGFGHGDGAFRVLWDSLTALDNWVEIGAPPANQVVVDSSQPGGGRARPLCEYPGWPQYNGSGDPNLATSFHCAQ
jgi:feruloyl esterase